MSKKMEMALADDFRILNSRSSNWVKDGIKDGEIPDWILVELLIRLPQKVVFKFKLVSKHWLSLILDPTFVKTYCSRALSLQKLQPWTFIAPDQVFIANKNKYLPDCEKLVDIHSINFQWPSYYALSLPILPNPYPRPRLHDKEYRIHQVSNGLVLYGSYDVKKGMSDESIKLRICNPVTNQWIVLPLNGIQTKYVRFGFLTNVEDGVLTRFTVVCLYENIKTPTGKLLIEVFSSEVGVWKEHTVSFDTRIRLVVMSKCYAVNGVLHWMIHKNKLIAYDPHKDPDQLYTIALPGEQQMYNNMLAAYGEQLRFFEISHVTESSPLFNIWVLDDYCSGNWCLQHRVYFGDVKIQIPATLSAESLVHLSTISFHPYDLDVAYLIFKNVILSYNIKFMKLEVAEEFSQVRGFVPWTLTQVLVFSLWPISFSPSIRV